MYGRGSLLTLGQINHMKIASLIAILSILPAVTAQTQPQQIIINPPVDKKPDAPHVSALPNNKLLAIVVIEGKAGKGTGFIAKLRDRLFVFTNQHVIAGNDQLELKTINGESLKYDLIFAGEEHDVAMFRLLNPSEDTPFFELESDPFQNTKTGDNVIVPGNSLGAGTILQARGKIISLGPKLVEHNAPTFSGNSGSPIVLESTMKVVGVDTLSKKSSPLDWANKFSREQDGSQIKSDVRLFGYRIDTIKKWNIIDLKRYNSEFAEIRELETEVVSVYAAVIGSKWHYQKSDTVSRIVSDLDKKISDSVVSKEDKESATKGARFALSSHLNVLRDKARKRQTSAYDFFKKDYKEIEELTDEVAEKVGNSILSPRSSDPFSARGF